MVAAHPVRIADAFAFFMYEFRRGGGPGADTDIDGVVQSGRCERRDKDCDRQNSCEFKQSPLFQPITGL